MKTRQKSLSRPIVLAVAATVVLVAAAYGGRHLALGLATQRAEAQLQKGFGALAAETVDPYRERLRSTEKGCRILLASYYQSRRADRLEWAGQACLESGIETPEVYIGLSSARELSGRDQDALQILAGVVQKFDKIPDIYYAIAQILRRNKRDAEAAQMALKAADRAGDRPQIQLDVIEYLGSLQRWKDAEPVAARLKDVKTDNPEVKLLIARVLSKTGNAVAAEPLVAAARSLVASNPQRLAAIQKEYPDLLGGGGEPQKHP